MKKTIASANDEKMQLEARFSAKAEIKAKKVAEEKKKFLTQIAQLELKIKENEADRTFLELELKNIQNINRIKPRNNRIKKDHSDPKKSNPKQEFFRLIFFVELVC